MYPPRAGLHYAHLMRGADVCHVCAGRILNVAVCPADTNEPPRVLNYLTAPDVYVWSAVSCSSAFPLLFAPQDLKCRNAEGEEVM